MADVNRGNRPLSPHLSIYRPQLTSMTSILTRLTGNALLLGALMVVWWLLAAATGPDYFATADWFMTSILGKLIMLGSIWALWYHSLAGLRHLIWDAGHGLEFEMAEKMGWAVIGGSVLLTIFTVILL
ncbi:succinate dehydrogenase, cytochrome b556 subunit [Actibacterium sp. 188UL27-1]|uniref:succinate dehydrogenase, cytochrome b556 subunit n=1 Tax=Actibacterium sp. 188UL27-1 TaxID=2786961 RepID=UPI00195E5CCB|nr:succinate dehydrogenase, cytochrome b556 subunit [Actibacterium sp. 188UL27-1]MBM7066539.1 succinate dehydrogenase, cytochrome b556 subunit [Actibacterium sp. 188UL27-1]